LSYVHRHLSRQAQTRQLSEAPDLILYPPTALSKYRIYLKTAIKTKSVADIIISVIDNPLYLQILKKGGLSGTFVGTNRTHSCRENFRKKLRPIPF
jgi:hypothetical protein